jgi:hypothetical protein
MTCSCDHTLLCAPVHFNQESQNHPTHKIRNNIYAHKPYIIAGTQRVKPPGTQAAHNKSCHVSFASSVIITGLGFFQSGLSTALASLLAFLKALYAARTSWLSIQK